MRKPTPSAPNVVNVCRVLTLCIAVQCPEIEDSMHSFQLLQHQALENPRVSTFSLTPALAYHLEKY